MLGSSKVGYMRDSSKVDDMFDSSKVENSVKRAWLPLDLWYNPLMNDITAKLETFRQLVETQQIANRREQRLDCETNIRNCSVSFKPGKKYTKVNIGDSGRYMVEVATGNIFGIKGYGIIHRGHFYGTLDTINNYNWGNYYPVKIVGGPLNLNRYAIPALTFAPETWHSSDLWYNPFMSNRYHGKCHSCGCSVSPGAGKIERKSNFYSRRDIQSWIVWCMSCFNASDNSGEEDRCCGNRAYEDRCAEAVDTNSYGR